MEQLLRIGLYNCPVVQSSSRPVVQSFVPRFDPDNKSYEEIECFKFERESLTLSHLEWRMLTLMSVCGSFSLSPYEFHGPARTRRASESIGCIQYRLTECLLTIHGAAAMVRSIQEGLNAICQ